MALVKCRECGAEISSSADKCPHCGKSRSLNDNPVVRGILLLVLAVIICMVLVSCLGLCRLVPHA
jgi:hypothetical protein